jgi:hypothetical protein
MPVCRRGTRAAKKGRTDVGFFAFLNHWFNLPYLAEANREAGLEEAEVLRQKIAVANEKKRDILVQEAALNLIQNASTIIRTARWRRSGGRPSGVEGGPAGPASWTR